MAASHQVAAFSILEMLQEHLLLVDEPVSVLMAVIESLGYDTHGVPSLPSPTSPSLFPFPPFLYPLPLEVGPLKSS